MTPHNLRPVTRHPASATPLARTGNRSDSLQLGNLAILASTSTGEVADPTTKPTGVRASGTTVLPLQSALDAWPLAATWVKEPS